MDPCSGIRWWGSDPCSATFSPGSPAKLLRLWVCVLPWRIVVSGKLTVREKLSRYLRAWQSQRSVVWLLHGFHPTVQHHHRASQQLPQPLPAARGASSPNSHVTLLCSECLQSQTQPCSASLSPLTTGDSHMHTPWGARSCHCVSALADMTLCPSRVHSHNTH